MGIGISGTMNVEPPVTLWLRPNPARTRDLAGLLDSAVDVAHARPLPPRV